MQFKAVTVALFAALVAADSIDDLVNKIPSCAKQCLDDGSTKAGCAVDDHKCQCNEIDTITKNSILCVSSACSSDEVNDTAEATTALCLAVAQEVGGDAFSSALSSITGAAGDAFTSATAAAGSEITKATGAIGSAFTSATGAAGSALTSATGAAGDAISSAVDGSSDAPEPTSTPAAANQAVAGLGMVGAAAMFALAL